MEDPIGQENRYLEMRKAAKTIADMSFEVDRLGGKVYLDLVLILFVLLVVSSLTFRLLYFSNHSSIPVE
jgi:hypothetical protein